MVSACAVTASAPTCAESRAALALGISRRTLSHLESDRSFWPSMLVLSQDYPVCAAQRPSAARAVAPLQSGALH